MPRQKKLSKAELYRKYPAMKPGNPGYIDLKAIEREDRARGKRSLAKREKGELLQGDPGYKDFLREKNATIARKRQRTRKRNEREKARNGN